MYQGEPRSFFERGPSAGPPKIWVFFAPTNIFAAAIAIDHPIRSKVSKADVRNWRYFGFSDVNQPLGVRWILIQSKDRRKQCFETTESLLFLVFSTVSTRVPNWSKIIKTSPNCTYNILIDIAFYSEHFHGQFRSGYLLEPRFRGGIGLRQRS